MAKLAPRSKQAPRVKRRPDIFRYHDFKAFLKDWIEFKKSRDTAFTLQTFAAEIGISVPYLSLILSGSRSLNVKTLGQVLPLLKLSRSEQSYFDNLAKLAAATSSEAKAHALHQMSKFTSYQKANPKEAETFQYMRSWYHVAIREMASLPTFQSDPAWIQRNLVANVPLPMIRDALNFLVENGYVVIDPNGTPSASKELIDCDSRVFAAALTEFHQQIFQLAIESVEKTPKNERSLEGFTLAMGGKRLAEARRILAKALDDISELEGVDDSGEAVYHVEIALFPLTKRSAT